MVEAWPRRNLLPGSQSRTSTLLPGFQARLRPFYIACRRKAGQYDLIGSDCQNRRNCHDCHNFDLLIDFYVRVATIAKIAGIAIIAIILICWLIFMCGWLRTTLRLFRRIVSELSGLLPILWSIRF